MKDLDNLKGEFIRGKNINSCYKVIETLISTFEKESGRLIISGILGRSNVYLNGDKRAMTASNRIYYIDCGIASYIAIQRNF